MERRVQNPQMLSPRRDKMNFLEGIMVKPVCNSARYLMIWTILASLVFLILDLVIERKMNLTILKIYNLQPNIRNKYSFAEFLDRVYTLIGYNRNWKYIKFIIEILFLPLSIFLYNYFCNKNYEIINWVFFGFSILMFIGKLSSALGIEQDVDTTVRKSNI
jgi:hypothetical protein